MKIRLRAISRYWLSEWRLWTRKATRVGTWMGTPGEGRAENCLCHSVNERYPGDAKQIAANVWPLREHIWTLECCTAQWKHQSAGSESAAGLHSVLSVLCSKGKSSNHSSSHVVWWWQLQTLVCSLGLSSRRSKIWVNFLHYWITFRLVSLEHAPPAQIWCETEKLQDWDSSFLQLVQAIHSCLK